jgi:hypothetical protein
MEYPRTPDVAGSVKERLPPFDTMRERRTVSAASAPRPRLLPRAYVWSLTLVLILFLSLMLIPPARAAILDFIQIGIVRIFPRPAETPLETIGTATPVTESPVTATPQLDAYPLLEDLNRIAGERTLSEAKDLASPFYAIRLPAYPPGLGDPDHVFVQDADGSMTILLWLYPDDPKTVFLSLYIVPEGSWTIHKAQPVTLQETRVNGRMAVWAVGPYPLWLTNGDLEFTRLIDGQVLIWTEGGITYRLETALPLDEAIRVAESLQPIP